MRRRCDSTVRNAANARVYRDQTDNARGDRVKTRRSQAWRKTVLYPVKERIVPDIYQADEYDDILPLLVPAYQAGRQRFLHVAEATLQHNTDAPRVVDLGCGSGIHFVDIVASNPKVQALAVDQSSSMLTGLRRRLEQESKIAERVAILTADASADSLLRLREASRFLGRTTLCCSAFLANNLSETDRLSLYRNVDALLAPAGQFLLWDIFGFEEPSVQQRALEEEILFIEQSFTEAIDRADGEKKRLMSLRNDWVHHYLHENFYPSLCANAPRSELSLMEAAGFSRSEVLFRFGMQAIILCAR